MPSSVIGREKPAKNGAVHVVETPLGDIRNLERAGEAPTLFEHAFDSVMDRLDANHQKLVPPKSGPNVVGLPES